MKTAKAKELLTVRTNPEHIKRLKELAKEQKTTVSALVDKAIEQLLGGKLDMSGDVTISKEDLEKLCRVVDAIGKPVPLKLLLTINEVQKEV